jgi:hypothetical protein
LSGRRAVLASGRWAVLACLLVLTSVALAACGSSNSPDATTLLRQTFSGSHTVNSGNLGFALTLQPSGSSTVSGPISLSFAGPFQSQGKGKLPKSNFTVSVGAGGHTTSLAIISTGTAGYVSLGGSSYQLPAGTFQKLESSFGAIATSSGGSAGGSLGKLGINPLHWLQSPSVVGTESVGGTQTTHIVAGVNVTALLADLNTFLQKASSLGVSGSAKLPKGISSQTQSKIAGEIQNPRFNLWTGSNDKTVRKMSIDLTLPVSGSISTALGGLTSARISLVIKYDDLNQPQTITAPTSVRPFSEFSSQLQALLSGLGASGIAGGSSGAGSSSSGASSSGSGSSSSGAGSSSGGSNGATSGAAVQKYSQCIQSAGQDVAKMQQCAALLGGK